jgi:hypothetical protein
MQKTGNAVCDCQKVGVSRSLVSSAAQTVALWREPSTPTEGNRSDHTGAEFERHIRKGAPRRSGAAKSRLSKAAPARPRGAFQGSAKAVLSGGADAVCARGSPDERTCVPRGRAGAFTQVNPALPRRPDRQTVA